MSIAVGIDLGTTFSVISYLKDDNKVEVIPNTFGSRTTPSIVAIDDDHNIFVGEHAIQQSAILKPGNIISSVKRSIGTNKRFQISDRLYSPEEISSEILKYLKVCAENYFGQSINDAVITVPAYFNNDQRQSTKIAGELAGFNVLRIINEPTAASIAYGLDKQNDSTILVYDLGGGTFDVTILKLSDGCDFHVLSTSGNTKLGGIDFDADLAIYIFNKFKNELKEKYEDFIDFDLDEEYYNKLLDAVEKTKKALSFSQNALCFIPKFIFKFNKIHNLQISISRFEFEQIVEKYIALTKDCVDSALKDAELSYNDIDEIVFVGGSTRIPYIAEKIKEWTNKSANKDINPDEAVSIGAAIQASVLAGKTKKEVYLIDVTPLSLGVETQGGAMSVMIKRNTQIPSLHKEIFTTAYDNQKSVDVKVFQGERPQTVNNHYLGEFKLDNIKSESRGIPKIEVSFEVDSNGILTVRAMDESNQNLKELILEGTTSLSDYDLRNILKNAEENKISDELFIKLDNLRNILFDYEIQIDELIETKLLIDSEYEDLVDLKKSLVDDKNSSNLELLTSLVAISKEKVDTYSNRLYEKAKSLIK